MRCGGSSGGAAIVPKCSGLTANAEQKPPIGTIAVDERTGTRKQAP